MKFNKEKITIITYNGIKDVDGYTFDYEKEDGQFVKLGVYNNGSRWHVIDLDTGLEITYGKSRKESIANANAARSAYIEHVGTYPYLKQKEKFNDLVWQKLLDDNKVNSRTSTVISLESIKEWAKDKEGLRIVQFQGGKKPENNPIWVFGDSRKWKNELKDMGFKWSKHKKSGVAEKGWCYSLRAE